MPKARAKKNRVRYEPVVELPPLSAEEYEGLTTSILVNGVLVPILVDCDGPVRRVIDGVHRKKIADKLGYICPEVVVPNLSDEELRTMARALNLARRQLDTAQKRKIIADQLAETPERSNRWVGKMLGVDSKTVTSVRVELEAGVDFPHLDKVLGPDGKHYPNYSSPKPSLQDTETPPSLCQWIYKRLAEAGVSPKRILDPCAGRGNLTRPFRPSSRIIEYEINEGRDFFKAKKTACDLVLCNPRWSEAERWLRHVVKVVGKTTPLVFICPMLFFSGYKDAPVRKFLQSPEAPQLDHATPLPKDAFVGVYELGAILWFNLPSVRDVALVPSTYLIRKNEPSVAPSGSGQQD